MAWRIIKQPNGRYARFSDVVDNFTHINHDRPGILAVCRHEGMSMAEAKIKVKAADDDKACPPFIDDSGRGDGLDRYRHAIKTIKRVRGKAAAAAVVSEME